MTSATTQPIRLQPTSALIRATEPWFALPRVAAIAHGSM